jgi:hypothetical protein
VAEVGLLAFRRDKATNVFTGQGVIVSVREGREPGKASNVLPSQFSDPN